MNKKLMSSMSIVLSGVTFLEGIAPVSQCFACKEDSDPILGKKTERDQNSDPILGKKTERDRRGRRRGSNVKHGVHFSKCSNEYGKFTDYLVKSLKSKFSFGFEKKIDALEIFLFYVNEYCTRSIKPFFGHFSEFLNVFSEALEVVKQGNSVDDTTQETEKNNSCNCFFDTDFEKKGKSSEQKYEQFFRTGKMYNKFAIRRRNKLYGIRDCFNKNSEAYKIVDGYCEDFTGASKDIFANKRGDYDNTVEKKTMANLFNKILFSLCEFLKEKKNKDERDTCIKKFQYLIDNLISVKTDLKNHNIALVLNDMLNITELRAKLTDNKTLKLYHRIGIDCVISCTKDILDNKYTWKIDGNSKYKHYGLTDIVIPEYMVKRLLRHSTTIYDNKNVYYIIRQAKGEQNNNEMELLDAKELQEDLERDTTLNNILKEVRDSLKSSESKKENNKHNKTSVNKLSEKENKNMTKLDNSYTHVDNFNCSDIIKKIIDMCNDAIKHFSSVKEGLSKILEKNDQNENDIMKDGKANPDYLKEKADEKNSAFAPLNIEQSNSNLEENGTQTPRENTSLNKNFNNAAHNNIQLIPPVNNFSAISLLNNNISSPFSLPLFSINSINPFNTFTAPQIRNPFSQHNSMYNLSNALKESTIYRSMPNQSGENTNNIAKDK